MIQLLLCGLVFSAPQRGDGGGMERILRGAKAISEASWGPLQPGEAEKLSHSQNAVDLYHLASKLMKDPIKATAGGSTPASKRAVGQNAESLVLISRAVTMPFHSVRSKSFGAGMPLWAELKVLTKLACSAGDVDFSLGRIDRAVAHYQLGMQMGGQLLHEGQGIIEGIVGGTCQDISRRKLRMIAEHLSPSKARALAALLIKVTRERRAFSKMFASDQQMTAVMLNSLDSVANPSSPAQKLEMAQFLHAIKAQGAVDERRFSLPFASRGVRNILKVPFPLTDDEKSSLDAGDLDQEWANCLRVDAENELLALRLAANAYQKTRGHWPRNIDDLAPVLGGIPKDSFAPGHSLRMFSTASGPAFYSVGPDGKDDRGHPIPSRRLTPNANGDIVESMKSIGR